MCNLTSVSQARRAGLEVEFDSDKVGRGSRENGKAKRNNRPLSSEESKLSTRPLDLVHADLARPMRYPSMGGNYYFIPFYDDSSALALVQFTKKNKVKCLHVKRLRYDDDSVFLSKNFQSCNSMYYSSLLQPWLQQTGIIHELTAAHSPESNGKAERLNGTLMDMARAMMMDIEFVPNQERFWAEAVNTSNYVRYRMFTSAAIDLNKTPFETIMGKRPCLKHVRTFGSKAFVHISKQKRAIKFKARAETGLLFGLVRGNSYRAFLQNEGRKIVSRDVTFEERSIELTTRQPDNVSNSDTDRDSSKKDTLNLTLTIHNYDALVAKKQPERYAGPVALQSTFGNDDDGAPFTYEKSIASTEKSKWKEATQEEINDINSKKSCNLIGHPEGVKPILNGSSAKRKMTWSYCNLMLNQHS
ncbi:unnamed protein product [Chondrus crispus]|uniref:Integrase catalytic domain-containing protein n=1 Tax=Chondrus crispus TaxID=2769 RepID=R7Q8J1_CHOCR|nr:unnamed protein product [Chondrus crispus]CDF34349.1 unnamed protein product [Chondrus crispus]|eukprot:XP_005714168.1 unnamed protein product [Chondrus crispus]